MPCGEQATVPPHPYPLAKPDSLGPMDPSHFAQPSHISVPETTGRVQLEQHSLFYELRGLRHQQKVVLLSPLACTVKFFGGLADAVSSQHQVLIYDYRGIGKSTKPQGRNWTSQVMAVDALGLLDQVWPGEAVHVAGISMGGFIAQKLAVLLMERGRLASLCLLVASQAYLPKLRLPLFAYDIISALVFRGPPKKLLEKSRKSQHLFLRLYAPGVADKPALAPDGRESTMGDLWMDRWMPEYSEWFAIDDRKAMAAQIRLCVRHKTTNEEMALLRQGRMAKTVYLAMGDKTIKPAAQRHMTEKLAAVAYEANARHLGVVDDFDNLVNLLLITINNAQTPEKLQSLLGHKNLTPSAARCVEDHS